MKHRLFFTFVASFALIIILGAAVNILFVAFSSRRAYARMVRSEDQFQAERIAVMAEEYYRQNRTLAGIGDLLTLPPGYGMAPLRRMGNGMMGDRMMDPSRMGHFVPPVLITGNDGEVYADPQGFFDRNHSGGFDVRQGVPVKTADGVVGRVFVGSMIAPALEDRDNEYLRLVWRSALISSLSVALVAIVLGGVLFRSIASPVEALASASRSIASGNLGVRVGIRRRDELGELIDQFNVMAESVEASEEWKRRIISDAAHELRTPVAVLQGELEMILEGVYTADRERIESLYKETELMARLIRELGELAAAEGGRLSLIREPCHIGTLAREAAAAFAVAAAKRNITITADETDGPVISGDSQKILQVIRNLLRNAMRAVPDGGRIDLYTRPEEGAVVLCVDDSGPGIPEEYREKIFQRFFRVDSSRARDSGGAGLGLAISQQIMLLHEGQIWADQGRNGGARINLLFPRA